MASSNGHEHREEVNNLALETCGEVNIIARQHVHCSGYELTKPPSDIRNQAQSHPTSSTRTKNQTHDYRTRATSESESESEPDLVVTPRGYRTNHAVTKPQNQNYSQTIHRETYRKESYVSRQPGEIKAAKVKIEERVYTRWDIRGDDSDSSYSDGDCGCYYGGGYGGGGGYESYDDDDDY